MKAPAALEVLRPGQWVKNVLVFACGFFAVADRNQALPAGRVFARSFLAFAVFCLVCGAIYIANDVHDRDADRVHPEKRNRPVASGRLPVRAACAEAAAAAALGLGLSLLLGGAFAAVAASYFALQLAYTFGLKRVAVLDAASIAAGFSLRVVAGAAALGAALYPWIVLCTFALAMFLALGKRRAELVGLGPEKAPLHRPVLARYSLRWLDAACAATALLAAISYSAWTIAPSTVAKFGTSRLVFTIPFVVFPIARYLRLVTSGRGGGRPEIEFLRHPELAVSVLLWLSACIAVFRPV